MMTCGDDKRYRKWSTSTWTQTYQSGDLSQVLWKCTYASEGSYAIGLDPGQVRIYNSANSLQSTYSPSASGKPYGVDFKYGTLDFIMGSDNSKAYTSASSSPILSGGGIFHEAKYARTTEYFMYAG